MLKTLIQRFPSTARGSFWFGFWLCLLICFFIVFVISPLTGLSKTFGGAGHDGYLEIARSVAKGDGFVCEPGQPPVACPPFYPLFLSPITLLPEGLQRPCLIIFQSAMVGGIASIAFLIGRNLFSISVARIAVAVFLLNPWIYWSAKNPMTPVMQSFLYILFVFLLGTYVFGVLRGFDNQTNKKRWFPVWLAIGLTGGALALTHGSMLPAAFILLFVAFILGLIRRNKPLLTVVVMSGCMMVVLVAPWTYRNWVVFGRFLPVAGNYGFAYACSLAHWNISGEHAQRPQESYHAAGLRFMGIEGDESHYVQYYGIKDPNIDAKFNEKAKEHIRTHPGMFLKKFILNSIEYYFPSLTYSFLAVKRFSIENLAITLYHLILWGLVMIGFYRIRRQKSELLYAFLLLAVIFLYAVWYWPVIAFIGHSIYTFGTMPFLSILAANGLSAGE